MKITEALDKLKFPRFIVNHFSTAILLTIRGFIKLFKVEEGSIVIISLHRLGDSVFTIYAIQQLQKFYNKELIIFCYKESVPIYEIVLKNVIYCPINRDDFYFNNRIASRYARKKLREYNPAKLIDLTGVMTSASLIFNSRAGKIMGMNRGEFKGI